MESRSSRISDLRSQMSEFSDLRCRMTSGTTRIDLILTGFGNPSLVLRLMPPGGHLRTRIWNHVGRASMARPVHPGYTTPGTPTRPRLRGPCTRTQKCAMGSKGVVRNSQMALEVILAMTIWLLAPILAACCKNHLVPKALRYLRLSNPLSILSRTSTLP